MFFAGWFLKRWSWKSLNLTKVVVCFSQSVEWTKNVHTVKICCCSDVFRALQAMHFSCPTGSCTFCWSEKIYSCLFITNCTRNHVITYTNIASKSAKTKNGTGICLWKFWNLKMLLSLSGILIACSPLITIQLVLWLVKTSSLLKHWRQCMQKCFLHLCLVF